MPKWAVRFKAVKSSGLGMGGMSRRDGFITLEAGNAEPRLGIELKEVEIVPISENVEVAAT